jgi:hypothetical protein
MWAERNVLMDSRAKEHLSVARSLPRHFDVKGEPWQLWIEGRKITLDIAKQIYSVVHNQDGLQYWLTKPDVS